MDNYIQLATMVKEESYEIYVNNGYINVTGCNYKREHLHVCK
jgi:hypothetical protein